MTQKEGVMSEHDYLYQSHQAGTEGVEPVEAPIGADVPEHIWEEFDLAKVSTPLPQQQFSPGRGYWCSLCDAWSPSTCTHPQPSALPQQEEPAKGLFRVDGDYIACNTCNRRNPIIYGSQHYTDCPLYEPVSTPLLGQDEPAPEFTIDVFSLRERLTQALTSLAEEEKLYDDFLYSRNKWHMLCNHLGWPADTTSVALISDAIDAGQRECAELKTSLAAAQKMEDAWKNSALRWHEDAALAESKLSVAKQTIAHLTELVESYRGEGVS
jgi:hypothetical protein